MRRFGHILIILILLLGSVSDISAQKRNNLITSGGNLILLIDLNSSKNDIDAVLKNAGITGVDVTKLTKGDFSVIQKDGWTLVKRQNGVVQFNRPLKQMEANPQISTYVITANIDKNNFKQGYLDADYGVNRFSNLTVNEIPTGFTRFILPGYLKAKRVFLSGSFNDWSTLKGAMSKTADGWMIDIKLKPGGYEYKYIVDSHWMDDPNNNQQVNDGGGNVNSVYYKYNYTFKLAGYPSAHKIALVGSFNQWNTNDIFFEKKGNAWECPLYLHEGTHAYRFVVDGNSITDPVNPNKYKDDKGNINSVVNIGEKVYFKLNGHTNAHNVYVAGDFNNWKPDDISLKKAGNTWVTSIVLPSGNYQYRFIVDGDWMVDPLNPYHAIEEKVFNSFLAVNPTHTFKLNGFDNAKIVHLAGSFNDWNPNEYLLGHIGNEWSISLYLNPGKCLYKFIVDDQWIKDPGNKLWEDNQYRTGNSFFWVE